MVLSAAANFGSTSDEEMVRRAFPKVSVSFFKVVKSPATVDVSPSAANVDFFPTSALSAVWISGIRLSIAVRMALESADESGDVPLVSVAAFLIAKMKS